MSNIIVGISDFKVVKNGEILITYALGSCIGICLFDKLTKVAGLAHIMLGYSKDYKISTGSENRFADLAINNMIREIEAKGGKTSRLTAKIAGGAQMFKTFANTEVSNVGKKNILAVKTILAQKNIVILAEDLGLDYGRTQIFDTNTGVMKIKSFTKGVLEF